MIYPDVLIKIDYGSGANPRGNINTDLYPDESDKHHKEKTVIPTLFCSADLFHQPFRDGIADFGSYIHSLEHLKCPYCALVDTYRILKKGGSIRIEIPNPTEWDHERDEHLYSWSQDTITNLVRSTGFRIVNHIMIRKNQLIEAVK
jgi:ubiquinone/menaquinone biosynthesis C-methylase UbiE